MSEIDERVYQLKEQLKELWCRRNSYNKTSDEWHNIEDRCYEIIREVDRLLEEAGQPFDPEWNSRLYQTLEC